MISKRVTIRTFVIYKKHEFVFEIGKAKQLGHEGQESFSSDSETFLSRIHLEDPKSAFLMGHLEQTASADLAADEPVIICELCFPFEIKSVALTRFADSHDIRMSKVDHLLHLKAYLHPADSSDVPPLVKALHFELL